MAAWSNEMVAIPVNAYTGIGESFITAIECHVIIDPGLVVLNKLLGAG